MIRLLYIGIKEEYTIGEKNRLFFFHFDTLLGGLMGILVFLFALIFGSKDNGPILSVGLGMMVLTIVGVLICERKHLYFLSIGILFGSNLLLIITYSFVLGLSTHFYFWIFVATILPVFLYPDRQSFSISISVVACIAFLSMLFLNWEGSFSNGIIGFSTESQQNFILFNDSSIFLTFGYKCWMILQIYKQDLGQLEKGENALKNLFDSTTLLNQELEQAKHLIEEEHDYLRSIIDVHPHSIFSIDPKGKLVLANKKFSEYLQLPINEIMGKQIDTLILQTSQWNINASHLKINPSKQIDATILPPEPILMVNGLQKWYQTYRIPIYHHETLQEVLFMSMDVSTQIENETAIQASERKYRTLFESSAAGIIIVDIEGRKALDCNLRAQEMFEASYEEVIKGNTLVFSPELQPDGQSSKEKLHQILGEFRRTRMRINSDWQFKSASGKLFDADITYSPLELNGSLVSVLLVRDVTEKNRAQQSLQEKIKELDATNSEMRRYIDSNLQLENFAYMASHDLKEPLRTTIAFSQLLQRRYADRLDEDGKDFLNYILSASKSMNKLITDLLAFSRVNTKGIKPERLKTRIFLKEIAQQLWSLIKETKGELVMEELPDEIEADKVHMHQLFQNLITNGLKFRKKDTIPRIEIQGKSAGKYWRFSISDNGIGIDPQYHDKIFLLFRKLHGQEDYAGTGIGLAMCKKIVEQHGGKIWLESQDGKGTTFYFTLRKTHNKARPE